MDRTLSESPQAIGKVLHRKAPGSDQFLEFLHKNVMQRTFDPWRCVQKSWPIQAVLVTGVEASGKAFSRPESDDAAILEIRRGSFGATLWPQSDEAAAC